MVDVVPKHVPENLLSRAWAEFLALRLGQGSWWVEHVSEAGDRPAGQGFCDHARCGLEPRDQLGGRAYRLPLLVPACQGANLGTALVHPPVKPPDAIGDDVLHQPSDRPMVRRHRQHPLLGRERRDGLVHVPLKSVPAFVDNGEWKRVLGHSSHGCVLLYERMRSPSGERAACTFSVDARRMAIAVPKSHWLASE